MKLLIVAVGQKLPAWAQTAVADYAKRFTQELPLEIKCVKPQSRPQSRTGQDIKAIYKGERERIESAYAHLHHPRLVVLDERGEHLTTTALAARLQDWQRAGNDVVLVIGGPDGLDPPYKQQAHERLQLSGLTLPHALARVVLVEALYRAWSVNTGHPYHRQ